MRTHGTELRSSGKAGLTLIETVFYASVLAVVTVPLASIVIVSSRSTADNASLNYVRERNRISLARIGEEARPARSDTVTIQNSGATVSFTQPDSFDGTTLVNGPTIRYDLMTASDENANGVDDDGDGLVDEGQLVRTDVDTGTTVTLCENVDLANSGFAWNGTTLTITLANVGGLASEETFNVSRQLVVVPRN